MPDKIDLVEKTQHYREALEQFLERLKEGPLCPGCRVGWQSRQRDDLAQRLDWAMGHRNGWGDENAYERTVRTSASFAHSWKNGVNIHAEIIAYSRFRRMVEGNSRTAFSCNFFALRELVYCDDPSIEKVV